MPGSLIAFVLAARYAPGVLPTSFAVARGYVESPASREPRAAELPFIPAEADVLLPQSNSASRGAAAFGSDSWLSAELLRAVAYDTGAFVEPGDAGATARVCSVLAYDDFLLRCELATASGVFSEPAKCASSVNVLHFHELGAALRARRVATDNSAATRSSGEVGASAADLTEVVMERQSALEGWLLQRHTPADIARVLRGDEPPAAGSKSVRRKAT